MTIAQMQYFIKLAEEKNFTKAADSLYISQSNLSYSIKSMEEELGRELFLRSNRKVELTDSGRQFLAYAVRICNLYNEALSILHEKESVSDVTIRITMPPSIMNTDSILLLQTSIQNITDTHMRLNIVRAHTTQEMINLILQEKADFMISYAQHVDLSSYYLFDKEFFIVMSTNHPLNQKERITWKDLRNENWVIGHENSFVYQYVFSQFAFTEHKPRIAIQTDDMWTQLLHISLNEGIGLLPAAPYQIPNIVYHKLTPTVSRPVYIAHGIDRTLTNEESLFLSHLSSCAQTTYQP